MVLPSFFSKSSPKKPTDRASKEYRTSSASPSRDHSSRSPSKSPIKSPRSSENTPRKKSSSSRQKSHRLDPSDIHPLNLPPEERERRRSAMSSPNGEHELPPPDPMEVDAEMNGRDSESYTNSNGSADFSQQNADSSPSTAPPKEPAPPPKPAYNPEECKALGNKYFKAKDYTRAIAEYSKGKF